jgi:hypothetical protein
MREMHHHSSLKNPLPIAGLPVNCCVSTPSPNGPLGSLATLQVYNSHKVNEDEVELSTFQQKDVSEITRVYKEISAMSKTK